MSQNLQDWILDGGALSSWRRLPAGVTTAHETIWMQGKRWKEIPGFNYHENQMTKRNEDLVFIYAVC
jgi:hypothetical protein